MKLTLLKPENWIDYELIDSGDGMKMERFGPWILSRPEPQALWRATLSLDEWQRRTDAWFIKTKSSEERGEWQLRPGMEQQWVVAYKSIRMRLGLTSFKHVGIFPEQASNWDFIAQAIRRLGQGNPHERVQVLNLFAYTGGATLAAVAAGADVTHVDSVKQVVSWSRENLELSRSRDNLNNRSGSHTSDIITPSDIRSVGYTNKYDSSKTDGINASGHNHQPPTNDTQSENNHSTAGIDANHDNVNSGSVRWIVDDAMKFVQRETRRARKYHGIVLDPPSYGRGANGEKWILEQNLREMLELCNELLETRGAFLVLNLYSMGLSALLAHTLVSEIFGAGVTLEVGELYVEDNFHKRLPLGVFLRLER